MLLSLAAGTCAVPADTGQLTEKSVTAQKNERRDIISHAKLHAGAGPGPRSRLRLARRSDEVDIFDVEISSLRAQIDLFHL